MTQSLHRAAPGGLFMQHIRKTFAGVTALDGVELSVRPGEIHGLIGENGAGKSTLIKILAGVYAPDSGEISVGGRRLASVTPAAVQREGIRFIHQELHLIPHFTVAESVFIGQERCHRLGRLDRRAMRADSEKFFREVLNIRLDGNRLIRDLSQAELKLVQIARALIDGEARLVVFDEPTAPLEAREAALLFEAIRALKARGIAIIYVSHYLNEITRICDRVTVLRNGKQVATLDEVNTDDIDRLIELMVGRELTTLFAPPAEKPPSTTPWLTLDNLGGDAFRNIHFQLAPGEIVGIAGLSGSGREQLIDALYGLYPLRQGTLRIAGKAVRLRSPVQAIAEGIALVPRDRRHHGLIQPLSVADNINIASPGSLSRFGWELKEKARQNALALAEKLDIRPRNVRQAVRYLSGGNQQKVILARWLNSHSQLFILDEPTLGVDVGARAEIYHLTRQLADKGRCVLVSSSDASELIGLCDRLLVMRRGEIVAEVPTHNLTQDGLLALTSGGSEQETPQ